MVVVDGRTGLQMIVAPECWRLLAAHVVGRLGVSVGGDPEVVPVNYVVDDHSVVFRTDAGTKYRALEHHPSVVLEIDEVEPQTRTGWSVQVKGRAEIVHDPVTLRRLRARPPTPWAPGEKSIWVRIRPTEVTGRRIAPPTSIPTPAVGSIHPAGPHGEEPLVSTTTTPVLLHEFVLDGLPWEALPAIGEGVEHKVLWRSGSSMAGLMRIAPGGGVERHAHRLAHHHLWVIDGSIEVLAEVLGPNSYVHIPAGVTHGIVNRGDGPATLLYLYLQPR